MARGLVLVLSLLLAQASAFVLHPVSHTLPHGVRSLARLPQSSSLEPEVPKAGPLSKPKAFIRKSFARPRAIVRRCLQSTPVTTLACAVILSSAAPAMARTSKYDFSDETAERIEKLDKQDAYMYKYAPVVIVPILIAKTITRSGRVRKDEKKRVDDAITRLEIQRDEFMNVEGKSSSDEDLFASLRGRSEELSEEEAEAAAQAALEAEEEEAAAVKARGEDLFDLDDDDDDAAKDRKDEDEPKEGMASKEDVERMKRMFGSS